VASSPSREMTIPVLPSGMRTFWVQSRAVI
jgi:hypothetical protein